MTVETELRRENDRLRADLDKVKADNKVMWETLFGEDNRSGLCLEVTNIRKENVYLRWIYVLATAVAMPMINQVLSKFGFPLWKSGG